MSSQRHAILPPGSEPCVWMSAGLVSYKLCDRDFDCEGCPLDSALRGEAPETGTEAGEATTSGGWDFPSDRTYARGHLWIQPRPGNTGGVRRVGLDALAAALLGACRRVRYPSVPRALARGEPFCELDLGVGRLSLAAPEAGRLEAVNDGLANSPTSALAEPYDAGWLVEVSVEDEATGRPWLSAAAAREQSELDLRRFRRGAALRMLVSQELGPVLADGGARLTDLRQMVGPVAYLELLRDLIH
jgi:glycine cleavage system H protein